MLSEKVDWRHTRSQRASWLIAARLPSDGGEALSRIVEFEQIQLLLSHASVQTTELGGQAGFNRAPNDAIGLRIRF